MKAYARFTSEPVNPKMARREPRRGRRHVGEDIFAVVLIFTATAALIPILQPIVAPGSLPAATAAGNTATIMIWLGFYTISVALLTGNFEQLIHAVLAEKWLLALLGLAILSTAWSQAPEVTFRRALALSGTSLVGFYLGLRFRTDELLDLVAASLAIAAILSLGASLVLSIGRMHDAGPVTGAWRGIYATKNELAQVMTLGLLVFLIRAATSVRRRLLWGTLIVAAGFVVIMANSMTSLGMTAALLILLPFYRAMQKCSLVGAACLAAGFIWAVLVTAWLYANGFLRLNSEYFSQLLSRDISTLTGRTLVWTAAWDKVLERPWVGWGHSSFWLGWDGRGSAYVLAYAGWNAGYGHNGFLDALLDLGLVGFFFLGTGLVMGIGRALKYLRVRPDAIGLWPLLFLTFLILGNTLEGGLLQQNYYMWILFLAVTSSLRLDLRSIARAQEWKAQVDQKSRQAPESVVANARPSQRDWM